VEACHRVTSQAHRSSLALRHLLLFTNELAKTAETRSSSSSCVPCYCDSSPSAIRRRRGRPALNCCRSTTSPTPTSTISSSIAWSSIWVDLNQTLSPVPLFNSANSCELLPCSDLFVQFETDACMDTWVLLIYEH
jgi:hypothetical protein